MDACAHTHESMPGFCRATVGALILSWSPPPAPEPMPAVPVAPQEAAAGVLHRHAGSPVADGEDLSVPARHVHVLIAVVAVQVIVDVPQQPARDAGAGGHGDGWGPVMLAVRSRGL